MELTQVRTYHPLGTNGLWLHEQDLVCYSIELPWLEGVGRIMRLSSYGGVLPP
jgi:hypothetical protein